MRRKRPCTFHRVDYSSSLGDSVDGGSSRDGGTQSGLGPRRLRLFRPRFLPLPPGPPILPMLLGLGPLVPGRPSGRAPGTVSVVGYGEPLPRWRFIPGRCLPCWPYGEPCCELP